jgi:hypothetical protein
MMTHNSSVLKSSDAEQRTKKSRLLTSINSTIHGICHFLYPIEPESTPVKLAAIKERKRCSVCINGGINMKVITKQECKLPQTLKTIHWNGQTFVNKEQSN